LQLFENATKAVEGSGDHGHHGVLWECLPIFESILLKLERLKEEYPVQEELTVTAFAPSKGRKTVPPPQPPPRRTNVDQFMAVAINHAWLKIEKYYILTDKSPAYIAAVVLNPLHTWTFFELSWRIKPEWVEEAKAKILKLWESYKSRFSEELSRSDLDDRKLRKRSYLDTYLDNLYSSQAGEDQLDEYERWCKQPRLVWDNSKQGEFNIYTWWSGMEGPYPILSRLARDLLSIPAMSAENERNFSSASDLISSKRNQLEIDSIEATECLRNWLQARKPRRSMRKSRESDDEVELPD
jgi:hypothetical protein